MDNFTILATKILTEHTLILKENQLAELSPRVGQSFGDFLRSLTGKTRKDILDAASYARLYIGNAYGMTSAANDDTNPKVLENKFLSTLANYINQSVMDYRPGLAETEEFKTKYGYSEYKEQEKERRELARNFMLMPSGPEKDAKRRIYNAFRNTSEYAEARRAQEEKEDAMVTGFHTTPIEPGDIVNDGSEEFMKLQDLYNTIQGNQHVTHRDTEDNESCIRSLKNWDVEVEDNQNTADPVAVAYDVNNRLADKASKGLTGALAGLAGTQAQKAKKLKDEYDKEVVGVSQKVLGDKIKEMRAQLSKMDK
tara:strand:- start:1553 stop:2482 length:930 start_codon:yes stop_codon:yes gene_type:complete